MKKIRQFTYYISRDITKNEIVLKKGKDYVKTIISILSQYMLNLKKKNVQKIN